MVDRRELADQKCIMESITLRAALWGSDGL